jgi:hypothetical protein
MQSFVHEMLHDSPAALRIMFLWKEYEVQATPEARYGDLGEIRRAKRRRGRRHCDKTIVISRHDLFRWVAPTAERNLLSCSPFSRENLSACV